jgi:hypothetical protein
MVDWIYRRVNEGKFPANLSDITTPERYGQLLKDAGYYQDKATTYIEGLRRWLQSSPPETIAALALAGLVISAWVFRREIRKLLSGSKKG